MRPKEILAQMFLGTVLACLFTITFFIYIITNPETNGPTASLEQNLESHLGTFC